jgi:DNA-binding NarL/FixJ family response regulator
MQTANIFLIPLVYIYSAHPLVYTIIDHALSHKNYRVKAFSSHQMLRDNDADWILIVDACSIKDWPKIAVQYGILKKIQIIVLGDTFAAREEETRLLYLGVRGIVPVATLERDILAAVTAVCAGRLWFPREALDEYIVGNTAAGRATAHKFTVREQQIIAFIMHDLSNKEISHALGISPRTVKFHISNILQKANAKNRKGLIKIKRREAKDPGPILLRATGT